MKNFKWKFGWPISYCAFYLMPTQAGLNAQSSNDDILEAASIELSGIEGIDLTESQSGQLTLKGVILRKSDIKRVHEFIEKHPEIKDRSRIDDEIKASGTRSAPAATIFLEVALIEVKKSAFRSVGMRTSDILDVESSFSAGSRNRLHVGTGDPVRAFLDIALQKGEARIHSKQSLVADEGKVGMFQVGGQFPIKILSGPISKVEFMNYGLILKFKAHLKNRDRVQLQIQSEISDIDMGSLIDGIPVMSKKDLRTEVTLKIDEMMAIGGIIKASQSDHQEGVPGISEVPVLGRLFRSEDFRKHRSEAYIFVHVKKMDKPWLPSPDL